MLDYRLGWRWSWVLLIGLLTACATRQAAENQRAEAAAPLTAPLVEPRTLQQPLYPGQAALQKIEGDVAIEFQIGERGKIKNPVVKASTPVGLFDAACLQSLQKRFYRVPKGWDRESPSPIYTTYCAFRIQPCTDSPSQWVGKEVMFVCARVQ